MDVEIIHFKYVKFDTKDFNRYMNSDNNDKIIKGTLESFERFNGGASTVYHVKKNNGEIINCNSGNPEYYFLLE